jgi:hypothetical protein
LLAVGAAPVILKPVKAEVYLNKIRTGRVHVLDHVGRRTGKSFTFRNNTILLDGAQHQALYYEVELSNR